VTDDTAWLTKHAAENRYTRIEVDGRGHWIGIQRLMFHYTMHKGAIGDDCGYDDRWCFQDQVIADYALTEWKARDFKGEPIGWHRHPRTGRRRPGGDATQEYLYD
jgi:hypothetical protein